MKDLQDKKGIKVLTMSSSELSRGRGDEESAVASEELSGQANLLQEEISKFNLK